MAAALSTQPLGSRATVSSTPVRTLSGDVVDRLVTVDHDTREAVVGVVGGEVVGVNFVIELSFLKGRDRLGGYDLFSLLTY